MGKLVISQELSDKISNSLRIKQSDIVDSSANKPIVRKTDPPLKKDSPIKKTYESPTQNSPIKHLKEELPHIDSSVKTAYKSPKQNSPIKQFHNYQKDYPIKRQQERPISYPKKLHKTTKNNKVNYMKISKIVFISSIVGGIGITLGIKLGTILFL
jgi:hypothetical protein